MHQLTPAMLEGGALRAYMGFETHWTVTINEHPNPSPAATAGIATIAADCGPCTNGA